MESNYAAFLLGHKMRPLKVRVADDRYPDENEIVIRVRVIAINQIDWKIQDTPWKMFKYPIIMGTDVAGEVVDVGSEVTRFKIGDRVLGHAVSFATEDERHAAMQNYSILMSNMESPIPKSLSIEQAVVPPLGATASRKSFDYVKQLGAAEVLDYRSLNKKEELLKLFRTRELAGAFDAIGVEDTFNSTTEIVAQASGRRFVASTGDLEDVEVPEGVEWKGVFAINIRDNEVGAMIYEEFLPEALKTGKYIIAPEPLIIGKGLSSVQAGIDASKSPSGKKVVVSI
ncbi:oxidoreductase [Biscogniauxia mediterranea]|nr:oxidoreductase [Biscogniauxia mediterranea]